MILLLFRCVEGWLIEIPKEILVSEIQVVKKGKDGKEFITGGQIWGLYKEIWLFTLIPHPVAPLQADQSQVWMLWLVVRQIVIF